MGQVYSTRFAVVAAGGASLYTVPPGKRAVVKCLCGYNSVTGTGGASIWVAGIPVFFLSIATGTGAAAMELMVTCFAGEGLSLQTSIGVSAQLSGYLLEDYGTDRDMQPLPVAAAAAAA